MSFLPKVAGAIARSAILRKGKELWERNQKDRNMPLNKWEKVWTGAYLIASDYASGIFPPKFHDRNEAHQNEINTRFTTPGTVLEELDRAEMKKPFWSNPYLELYVQEFLKLVRAFETANVRPPAKILELGGGAGWTAEFLVQFGYSVVSSTISPYDTALTAKRADALRLKGLPANLQAITCPMESISEHVKEHCPFDAVFVVEALHHAFNWRETINSVSRCVRPGGWFLVCHEPNVLHTGISYRVARLTNTHEVGFLKSDLISQLKQAGFKHIISLGKRPHLFYRPHWLLAQK